MNTKHQVKRRLLLDVVVAEGAAVLDLLSAIDQTLHIGGDALLLLDLGFHVVNSGGRPDIEGGCLTREAPEKDLHAVR